MANSKPFKELRDVEMRLRKKDDVMNEAVLILSGSVNWENFLLPAPYTVRLLGQLMLIATKRDFRLDLNPPENGFKLLTNPRSFNACLSQVAHEGYKSFGCAQDNMESIQLLTSRVPGTMKNVVKILLKGSKRSIQQLLPIEQSSLAEIAKKCLMHAQSTKERFDGMMELTHELLGACIVTEGEYENKLDHFKIEKKVLEERKGAAKEEREQSKEEYDMIREQFKDVEKKYQEALENLPAGWDVIKMHLAETLASSLSASLDSMLTSWALESGRELYLQSRALSGASNVVHDIVYAANRREIPSTAAVQNQSHPEDRSVQNKHLMDLNSRLLFIYSYVAGLNMTYVTDGKLNMDKVRSGDEMVISKTNFEIEEDKIKELKDSQLKDRVCTVIAEGKEICTQLVSFKSTLNIDNTRTEALVTRLQKLQTETLALSIESKTIMGGIPTQIMPPSYAALQPEFQDGESTSKVAYLNAQFKISSTERQLESARKQFQAASKQRKEANQHYTDIMAKMEQINLQTINFVDIKKILQEGIQTIGILREQWSMIVEFFKMMSRLTEESMSSMEKFIAYTEIQAENTLAGYSLEDLNKDFIYQNAFEAAKIAYLVNRMAGTYTKVSSKYIVHKLAGLGGLLQYDCNKDKDQIEIEYKKLTSYSEEATRAIGNMIAEEKIDIECAFDHRMKTYKTEMEAILPTVDSAYAQCIEQAKDKAKQQIEAQTTLPSRTARLDLDNF